MHYYLTVSAYEPRLPSNSQKSFLTFPRAHIIWSHMALHGLNNYVGLIMILLVRGYTYKHLVFTELYHGNNLPALFLFPFLKKKFDFTDHADL